MSWETLHRARGSRGEPDKIYMAYGKFLIVAIGAEVAKALGWKRGEKVTMQMGTGEHRGRLRLCRDAHGDYTLNQLSQGSSTLKVQRYGLPGVARERHKRTYVEFAVQDGGLVIELPDWALPGTGDGDSRKPHPRNPAPPATPSGSSLPAPGPRDVIERDRRKVGLLPEAVDRRCAKCAAVFKTNIVGRVHCGAHPVRGAAA